MIDKQNNEWETIFQAIGHPAIILDPNHKILAANSASIRLTGKTASEIIGRQCYEIFHGKDITEPPEGCPMEKLLNSGQTETVDMEMESLGGIFLVSCTPVFDELGKLQKVIHIATDITERKKAEERVLQERNFADSALNSLPGIFYMFDMAGKFLRWNTNFEKVTEYTYEEVSQAGPMDFFAGSDRDVIQKKMHEVFVKGSAETEAILVSKSGKSTPYYFNGHKAQINGVQCLIGMGINISDKKKIEEQLRQSQKMEAVGHLAGGIAHDFNNILTAIIGYGSLLKNLIPANDLMYDYVQQILTSSEKAASLTHSLLAFSRKQIIELKPVDANDIALRMQKILARIIGEDIEINIILSRCDLIVMADQGQIELVLMNLATNARDAMPNGGRLSLTTNAVEIDDEFVKTYNFGSVGKYAVITFSDTGSGMDKKTADRIFEPFFTTKQVGKGTGLGLAMVYGTIKQHNGFINLYSEPGEGTTFRIYLPLAKTVQTKKEEKTSKNIVPGNETILLIEDDEAVRNVTKAMLEHFGYTVIEAFNGTEALQVFEKNKDAVQLVISDIIMPGQNGKETYNAMKQTKPNLKVLFVSGYTANILTQRGILDETTNFISKPLNPNSFSIKIREVLDK
ncbi:MAG: PAS domain S-box protein [Nitrospirae bacterium]|nr:PAS domain S-box protein [Nitrospirota bacterium]